MKNLFLLFILIFHIQSKAQNTAGAVSTATGGAGVGVLDMNEGVLINPALIPAYKQKQMTFSYSKNRFGVSLADNGADALFPAVIAYEQLSNDFFKGKIFHLILAYDFAKENSSSGAFTFGLDYGYNDFKILSTDKNYKQNKLSAGLFFQANTEFAVGLVYKNKGLNDTELPNSFDQASSISGGFSYVYQTFAQFRLDIEKFENQISDRYIYKLGLETYLNEWIITRIGYRNDNLNSLNFTTLGLGFAGPQFNFHYAYQTESKNSIDPLHVVDLSVPF